VELYERGITAETQPLDFPAHVDDRGIVMVQETIPSALSTSRGIPAQLFAALISSSDDAIIVKSLDGVIWTWNQGAMRMYGYTPDAAIGQPMTMLSPPDRVGEIADILVKIRKGERVSHYETTRQRKDGTTFPASMSVFPVNDEYGNMVGAASIARDITEESQARRASWTTGILRALTTRSPTTCALPSGHYLVTAVCCWKNARMLSAKKAEVTPSESLPPASKCPYSSRTC